jgi:hypothetical protein
MAIDVYVIGLFDDYMSCQLVNKAEWDRLSKKRGSLGDQEFDALKIGDEDTFDLRELFEMQRAGNINVIDVAEGYSL